MKAKLFDYVARDNVIYNLSGLTKILCFLLLTGSAMFSYDIRFIISLMLFSIIMLRFSEITFSQIRLMVIYVAVFLTINFFLTYLFSPEYAVEIYGTKHVLFTFVGHYTVTSEQLLYLITKLFKYACVVPLGIIFFLSTNPSEFAASVNRIGIPYKVAYAFSLTLRYFPDIIRDYSDISVAQQCRGLDLSKKEKLSVRIKNTMTICIPLVFSTLDRIEMISNTMELRSFGKEKNRTWYCARPLQKNDFFALFFSTLILMISLYITIFVNHSRFYNPFI
ncbi:MAG: energy-coupling factor transporter transmembrane component T [Spirochaetales bacterium]